MPQCREAAVFIHFERVNDSINPTSKSEGLSTGLDVASYLVLVRTSESIPLRNGRHRVRQIPQPTCIGLHWLALSTQITMNIEMLGHLFRDSEVLVAEQMWNS
jgi:hypothetical protein